jgi:NAD(P)-dependent dehydrogenase (short-subunit alcohol dehydrogenase family)
MEKMRLDGKTALVTGGARGIGKCAAAAFAEAGADVAIADLDIELAKSTAAELAGASGKKFLAVKADVTDQDQVNAMMEEVIGSFGELNVSFCNAGICLNTPAEEMTLDEWRKVIDINLTGVFLTAQASGRQMIKQGKGGSIIATASMSAHIVNWPQPQCAYNASKAGVIQLVKSLAVEWASKNVRVNSISPGYIETDITKGHPFIPDWNAVAPMRRLGKPEELVALLVYLAGDASSFTSGSDFLVDGAFTCV